MHSNLNIKPLCQVDVATVIGTSAFKNLISEKQNIDIHTFSILLCGGYRELDVIGNY